MQYVTLFLKGLQSGFPTMTSCQRCLIFLPPVNYDAKHITTRMKVSLTSERKRKVWIFSWCASRSTLSRKYLRQICSKNCPFYCSEIYHSWFSKWDGIFEQKIFKEKSNLGYVRSINVNEDPTEFIDFCVSTCKYQQSGRFDYFHEIWAGGRQSKPARNPDTLRTTVSSLSLRYLSGQVVWQFIKQAYTAGTLPSTYNV